MRHWLAVAGCLGVLATADVAGAQGAIVTGKVIDEQGSPVAGATISFHDAENDRSYDTESKKDGDYLIMLRRGLYQITVQKEGFRGQRFEFAIPRRGEIELPTVTIESAESIMEAAVDRINRQFEAAGALASAGELDEALAAYGEILAEQPDLPDVHYAMGVLYLRKEEPEPATRSLERALELRPEHGPTALALADVYGESGRGDEAAALIEKTAAGHPDDAEIQIGAAYFFLTVDQRDSARPFLERVRALQPENAEVYYLLATLAAARGEIAEAVELLERFLELSEAGDKYRTDAEGMLPGLKEYLARQEQSVDAKPQP